LAVVACGGRTPLLSTILLGELDRELERRGYRFVRYADDANIYVGSRRTGERVLNTIECFLNQLLKLTLNSEKAAPSSKRRCTKCEKCTVIVISIMTPLYNSHKSYGRD
jgi:hypothetical protein